MIYLGISLGFNSSASLWRDDECLVSISQERLTGVRNTKQVPMKAVQKCFEIADVPEELIAVGWSFYEGLSFRYLEKNYPFTEDSSIECPKAHTPELWLIDMIEKATGKTVVYMKRIEHHTAHLYSAYAVYGKSRKRHTILTMDGFGDGISARLTFSDGKDRNVLAELPLEKSPALYYQFVTGALGFKEHQHEGKITGLATGNYCSSTKSRSICNSTCDYFKQLWEGKKELMELDEYEKSLLSDSTIIDFDKFLRLRKTVYSYVKSVLPDDYSVDNIEQCEEAIAVAIAVQQFAKDTVMDFLHKNIEDLTDEIYLAGGMFANVAINWYFGVHYQSVYISPAMGDEGTAMGAAACLVDEEIGLTNTFHPEYIIDGGMPIEGEKISDEEIVEELSKPGLNNIVHLCTGRSEFGPRALMHRSSLFSAVSKMQTNMLNTAMHRSEFMPYAPVCRAEEVDELFRDWRPFEKSLHFMTVALVTKSGVYNKYPAAVHKDGTCRVQVLHEHVPCEKQAWDILSLYREKTHNDLLINTSFNVHNEPTCCTKEQCVSAWERSGKLGRLIFKTEER